MINTGIKLMIAFIDSDLEPEEREDQAQRLIADLKKMDEVDRVERIPDPNPPEDNKFGSGSFLMGLLMAEVSVANAKKLLAFLGTRLGNQPIELSVEANGKKLSVKASSREELEVAIKAAQDFIDS